MQMLFGSVQKMVTLFTGRHIGGQRSSSNMAASYLLYNFARNISTNISTLGQRTHFKLGELSSLFIAHDITISGLYPLHGFSFYFLLRDNAHT